MFRIIRKKTLDAIHENASYHVDSAMMTAERAMDALRTAKRIAEDAKFAAGVAVERAEKAEREADRQRWKAEAAQRELEGATSPPLFCSFCGKSQHEVRKLIAGGVSGFICEECVVLCVEILAKTPAKKERQDENQPT